eukprot:GFKZ01004868.1.p1 GENE.GFKZ01004868.1~~GFKZ01004868.1.p1  ORF type:complete len:2519 (+),score=510.43 GFKZ01004868.1:235-7791(+)
MNYLSGALRYVAGGDSDQRDAVPRLIDRIKTSALPQDRRTAIAALVDAAKRSPQQQVLVGELAIKLIYAVLEQDKDYDDNIKATLDLLIAICGTLDPPDPAQLPALLGDPARGMNHQEMLALFDQKTASAASTNVDMFLGMPNSVSLLLDLLEKTDFYVKFSAIELLTAMAANSRQTLQMAVLEAPQGVSRICDLLDDGNRLLRSNAVLLLSTLCDQSSEICKIVAYGGVLEKLFTLIESVSGDNRGGDAYDDDDFDGDSLEAAIVVQDVLLVLRNLVRGAGTTKTFMRDTACIPRLVAVVAKSAAGANMLPESPDQAGAPKALPAATGTKLAVEKQSRKNLVAAMQCVDGLVKDGDTESDMIKNDLSTTNIFHLLAGLAFTTKGQRDDASDKPLENALQVRVAALRTISILTRGHDSFRSMFGAVSVSLGDQRSSSPAQVAALRAMLGDSAASVRAAAYLALRESFVVDVRLDLPSSNLLNAIGSLEEHTKYSKGGRGMGTSLGSAASNPVQIVADSLKTAVTGWPNHADPAGVFYSASLLSWLVARVQGAKEKMLSSVIDGGALLPQMIRLLGKVEREKGPPEIRIALFTLACVWLHECPPAVYAFLSSAMHLPMLVDVIKGTGSRGDVAEVHVRGLAAVLLGICWKTTDGAGDAMGDSNFLSSGVSAFIPKGTISDVIRNRIGITVFTACLDDLRSTKAFSLDEKDKRVWVLPERLVAFEDRSGLMSLDGGLGHERWYESVSITVMDDVYKTMGARALDLLDDESRVPLSTSKGPPLSAEINGHGGDVHEQSDDHRDLLADSTRDEVLNSYKEFIRSQDESLNAARRQIDELTIALREAQVELDAKINSEAEANRSQDDSKALEELLAERDALRALLEEKNADFQALTDAYAALEEEHNSQAGGHGDSSGNPGTEFPELQSRHDEMRDSLKSELSKNRELAHRISTLESALSTKDAELRAVGLERDHLRHGVSPDAAQALQWRTEANLALAELASSQSTVKSLQLSEEDLNSKMMDLERYRADDGAKIRALEKQLAVAQSELHDLRSVRKRELQVAREASRAADVAAKEEITQLRQELAEARQDASANREQNDFVADDDQKRFQLLERDHRALLSSFDQMKVEVMDARNALSQWQRKSEAEEAEKNRQIVEVERLTKLSRDLGQKVQILTDNLKAQTEIATSASARVSELEQQSAELDEMRRLADEESKMLKEELATRTEQTIRLSGQLYEAEEGKLRLEDEIGRLTGQLTSAQNPDNTVHENHEIIELRNKLIGVEEELSRAKDELCDAKDRESLSQAQARDREDFERKASMLETALLEAKSREAKREEEITELKEKLLCLDEAEDAKRALTMQVIELQKSLASANSSPMAQSEEVAKQQGHEETVKRLDTLVAEKELRISGLESSLTAAMDRIDIAEKEKADLRKQVTETETTLSVLQSQRKSLSSRCDDLSKQLEEKPPYSEMDRAVLGELERQLAESERLRKAVSAEFASLVDACRYSEEEIGKIRNDGEAKIAGLKKQLESWKEQCENLSLVREVDRVVSSLLCNVSLAIENDANTEKLKRIGNERDAVITSQIKLQSRLDEMKCEYNGLQVALRECEDKLTESVSSVEKLTQVNMRLDDMQSVVEERDELRKSLEAAELAMRTLEDEKNAAVKSWEGIYQQQAQNSRDLETIGTEGSTATATHRTSQNSRVKELEDALRDAARTVSATNLEVIAAQALLVELSADKTAMRTELEAARREIDQLNARLSIGIPPNENGSTLSVISEQEQTTAVLDAEPEIKYETQEFNEQLLRAARAEIENLETIMKRSIVEADSAASLVKAVNSKVGYLEERLHSAHELLRESKAEETRLEHELKTLQDVYSSEKDNLLNDVRASKSLATEARKAADSQSRDLNDKMIALEQSMTSEREVLAGQLVDKEKHIEEISNECGSLRSRLEEISHDASKYSQEVQTLKNSNSKYSSTVSALEAKVSSISTNLLSSQARERSLEVSFAELEKTLRDKEQSFVNEKKTLKEAREKDVEEFEAEIDRCNDSMEEAERRFRDSENALKGRIQGLEDLMEKQELDLESSMNEVNAVRAKLESTVGDKTVLEKRLAQTMESFEGRVAELVDERDCVAASLSAATAEKDEALGRLEVTMATLKHTTDTLKQKEVDIGKTRLSLEKAEADLKEEIAHRTMLERENQEFNDTIETLESVAKRMRAELSSKKQELENMGSNVSELRDTIEQQKSDLDDLRGKVSEKDSNLSELKELHSSLELEIEDLRDCLKKRIEEKRGLEQDNSDLKAWVADLERQATELQSAAGNFEDVELNLREALEAQRGVAEQNAELTEEIRKERETLSSAEAQMRGAIRDKVAAEAARDSSQRRASELEERVREIREEHLAKVSQSEEMIRSKARRCAELESELASAERKVAELASVSDMVFSAKVEVNQRDEDIERLKRRAEVAEERAEELEMKVQSCENEMAEMRESGRGESYKALEAEYNELLVCLADLELECVTLKEELGRE